MTVLKDVNATVLTNVLQNVLGGGEAGATGHRFFRLDITLNNGNANTSIDEFQIMVGAVANPTVNMTSDILPSPLVALASGIFSAGFEAFKVFDGGTGRWAANTNQPVWVQVDLGVGNEIVATSFKITAESVSAATASPKDFTFEGSNTGAFAGEEEVLKTVTGEISWTSGEVREYTI